MNMDSNSGNECDNPKRLKILASIVEYAEGNNLLHQFVLDNSPPHQSRSESYLNTRLLAISSSSLNVNAVNNEGYSPLHLAVLKNNSIMVKKLLSCLSNIDVNTRCPHNENTALHLAANLGHSDIVEALLDKEAIIDIANIFGETALCFAARSGHEAIIKLLGRRGANLYLIVSNQIFPHPCGVESGNESPNIKQLKTLASSLEYDRGNNQLHQFVLDYSTPHHSRSESDLNDYLLTLSSSSLNVNALNEEGYSPLHLAVLKNDILMVKKLLSCLSNIDVNTKCNMHKEEITALHLAVSLGHLDIVEALLDKEASIDIFDIHGNTALLFAARLGHSGIIKLLVGKGANVNRMGSIYFPLHYAAKSGNLAIAEFLVSNGAVVSVETNEGWTPLFYAARYGHLGTLKFLLDRGANLNIQSKRGRELFLCAIESGDLETIEFLIDKGADLNTQDEKCWTPLHQAIKSGTLAVVEYLVRKGANVNAKDSDNETPLHYTARDGNIQFLQFLLNNGGDINVKGRYGRTPLHDALDNKKLKIVKYLLDKGADFDVVDEFDRTSLHFAVDVRQLESVALLIDKGANVNAKDKCGLTPLHKAVMYKFIEVAKMLIERGADVNATDVFGEAPLHKLLDYFDRHKKNYNEEKIRLDFREIKLLLDGNADVNIKDEKEETPLCLAMRSESSELIELLLESAAKLKTIHWNAMGDGGQIALHYAVQRRNLGFAALLLDKGVDVNAKDEGGRTPLHKAVMSSIEVTKMLIERGADVNATDDLGRTPLHHLLHHTELCLMNCDSNEVCLMYCGSNEDIIGKVRRTKIKLLLEGNADVNIKDKNGRTPLGLARQSKRRELIELFSEIATKPKSTKD